YSTHQLRGLSHLAGALPGRPHAGFHPGGEYRRRRANLRQSPARRGAVATHTRHREFAQEPAKVLARWGPHRIWRPEPELAFRHLGRARTWRTAAPLFG